MKRIQGIAAASGIAIARAYLLQEPVLAYETDDTTDPAHEIMRLETALLDSERDIKKIAQHTKQTLGPDYADIFSAHLLMLKDPEFIQPIKEKINEEMKSAEAALESVTTYFLDMFQQMDNDYMRERAADIRDVTKRIMGHLLHVTLPNPALIQEDAILISHDLTPSDTAQINKKHIKGFITDIGASTSHTAIMARTLDIPAIVGTKNSTKIVRHGDWIILDGKTGEAFINPKAEQLRVYRGKIAAFQKRQQHLALLKDKPTKTKDHFPIQLGGNIGAPSDITFILANGAENIGLFRTEFLLMNQSTMPTEEQQFKAYQSVLRQMKGKPVTVRTFDIGGDKPIDYLDLPKEQNPFLGLRAIRYTLANQAIFRTQLRALLRASVYGHLKIMFPMIATLEELRLAKDILMEEKDALIQKGLAVADRIDVGIMIEVPATAIQARQFAKEVDFFSIGTNDLIQYTMAVDRMNEHVASLYQPYHPAILSLIQMIIQAAHAEGKPVGMCGEMAADPIAIPILVGLGLDTFSMTASSILPARSQIRHLSKQEMEALAQDVLTMENAVAIKQYVQEKVPNIL